MKKFLIIAGFLGVVGWFWGQSWLEDWNQQRSQEAKVYLQKGEHFGAESNQQQCLDQALSDLNGCSGNTCTINQGLFLKACWQEAAPVQGFCDGVPPYRLKALEKEKEWARYYCRDKDISHEGCRFLLKRQQYFCSDGIAADADEVESSDS